jgi:exonuclease VII small subunit
MSQKSNMTIAEKQATLAELVAWFESDLFVVEQAIEKFKEAEQLTDEIEQELNEYKNTITVLKQKFTQE